MMQWCDKRYFKKKVRNHSHYTINNNKHKLGSINCQYEKRTRNCEYAFHTLTNTNIILVISVNTITQEL